MNKFFTALSVAQYRELLKYKTLPLADLAEDTKGLTFTEDKEYWVNEIKNQEDLESVADYKYALLISFDVETAWVNSMMNSESTGRLSEQMTAYHKALDKASAIPQLSPTDNNVLCILDAYKSNETADKMAQKWLLKVDAEDSPLWQSFSKETCRISCVGGIPGALEVAKSAN